MTGDADVTVVVATHNRRDRLMATLGTICALPEEPPVVVVDNGSSDGTAAAVRGAFPAVAVIPLGENRGAAARTAGAQAAATECVAFCDDDSWWAPGALTCAAGHFAAHPRLGLLTGRVLVGPDEHLDPLSTEMAASPLGCARPLPGAAILGFAACAVVLRRQPFLQTGGFSPVLFFLGEEQMAALDLASAGWDLAYAPDVVAHHHPAFGSAPRAASAARRVAIRRNDLLTAWMRRPAPVVLRSTARLAARAVADRSARRALVGAVRRLPAAMAQRRTIPAGIEQQLRQLRHF